MPNYEKFTDNKRVVEHKLEPHLIGTITLEGAFIVIRAGLACNIIINFTFNYTFNIKQQNKTD